MRVREYQIFCSTDNIKELYDCLNKKYGRFQGEKKKHKSGPNLQNQ